MTGDSNDFISKVLEAGSEVTLPEPVQRGLFKAIGRLVGGLIDFPAAHIEKFADDVRASTEARKTIRIEAAKALSADFKSDNPLANRVYAKNLSKIIGEQVNIEDVVAKAVEDLAEKGESAAGGDLDDDWLSAFESEACKRSSEEMKQVFGRILSGEIQSPGAFSIQTIRALALIGSEDAELFSKLCSLLVVIPGSTEYRLIAVKGDLGGNSLMDHGFSYMNLIRLVELGLLSSSFDSRMDYKALVQMGVAPSYVGKRCGLKLVGKKTDIHIRGVILSSVGRELYHIVEMHENSEFTKLLISHLGKNGIELSF